MHTAARVVLAVTGIATVMSCSDQNATGTRRAGLTRLAIAPAFQQAPAGGPLLAVANIRGVLATMSGTDSIVAEATVAGDTAILEFGNVMVRGDSSVYALSVRAFDADGASLFEGSQTLTVKPGSNTPAAPTLTYTAADAAVATLLVAPAQVSLDWAGANPNDRSCLNRAIVDVIHTAQQLSVVGKDAGGASVPALRVGWSSRDTTVATVDETGVVRSRCSNKATWIVARTFTDKADSVLVSVIAPPFALAMAPDSADVARDDSVALTAKFVDEGGNPVSSSTASWQ
ncbi:MAG TPA: hypothetical protein VKH19_02675, partial [Gemmatimonadaceae bacterium]|nr:hypothetical protein [Gemmatimonadaceae bacterium]